MSQRSHQYLRLEAVVFVNLDHLPDQIHSHMADVIQPSHKWAYVSCTGLSHQQGLVRREAQREIGWNARLGETAAGLYAVPCCRQLPNYILVPGGLFPRLLANASSIC